MQKLLKKYKHPVLKYCSGAILLSIALFQKFPLSAIPGSQVSLRLEDFLIAIVALLWLVFEIHNIPKIIQRKTTQIILLFWLIGFISLLSAIFVTNTAFTTIGVLHWARRVQYMIVFFIGYSSIKSKKDIAFFIKLLFVIVIYTFIYGVGQKYLQFPIITTQNSEYAKGLALYYKPGAHLVSTFAGHYDLASYLILILPLFFVLFLAPNKILNDLKLFKNLNISRAAILAIILMALWVLVNAASRISIVSYLGSVSLALLFTKNYKFIPIVIIVSILFIGFSSNLIDRYMRIFKVVNMAHAQELIDPTPMPEVVFEDRSTSIRLNVEWPRAMRAFNKNPLLGTGYSSITLATDNDYLRMLGEIGLLGFITFFVLVVTMLVKMLSILPLKQNYNILDGYVLGLTAGISGIALNMVFIDILEASKFAISFWLLLGFAMACIKIKNEKNN